FASRRFFSASLSTSVPEVEGNETGGNGSVLSLFSSTGVVEGKTGGTSTTGGGGGGEAVGVSSLGGSGNERDLVYVIKFYYPKKNSNYMARF
ncbi:MAG: hypothetical protein O7C62_07785, partial [Rickettsia endosymbiont of Ixodes persulcatus]|nr:hypothetical protein [Rickettsia endosymbiont of Ixodes persulcatus]